MRDLISSKEFEELLCQALLDSRWEMTKFQNELKEKYKKAWGSSDWLDTRLAKEYTKIIVNNMLDKLSDDDEEHREIVGDQYTVKGQFDFSSDSPGESDDKSTAAVIGNE